MLLKLKENISIMLRFSNWLTVLEDFDIEVDFNSVYKTERISNFSQRQSRSL
jgi:hypothetical protein